MQRSVLFVIFGFILFSSLSCTRQVKQPLCEKGTIDLSGWDFEKEGPVNLKGDWEFYWHFLITPVDFEEYGQLYPPPYYIKVPSLWDKTDGKGGIKPLGFGTYRLVIKTNKNFTKYGITIPRILSAHKLWINGELIEQKGVVTAGPEGSQPEYVSSDEQFTVTGGRVEIILQVSNYHSAQGGIFEEFQLGTADGIKREVRSKQSVELFLIGSLIIMCLYHLGLFVLRTKEKSSLYFGLLCLLIALRVSLTGQTMLLYFFPSVTWHISYFLEYMVIIGMVLLLIGYFSSIFRELVSKKVIVALAGYFVLLGLILIFGPSAFYFRILIPYFMGIIFAFFYLLGVIIMGIRKKSSSASIFLAGVLILFATALNDLLKALQVHYGPYIFPQGTFIFIFFQAVLILRRMTLAFKRIENLSTEMEEKVSRRSMALFQKNRMMTESISYAKRIQLASMPVEAAVCDDIGDFFVLWKPREIVGGDIYWFRKKPGAFLLAVIDCTGHGVPGAFMTMMVNSILTKIVEHVVNDDPARILAELNSSLRDTLNRESGHRPIDDGLDMGLVYCVPAEKKLIFAGARVPLFYREQGLVKEIKGDSRSLGYASSDSDALFTNHTVPFSKKSTYFMTSDGLLDQCGGEHGLPLGRKNFKQILENFHEFSLLDQKRMIFQALKVYMKSGEERFPQLDDITLVGFRV